MAEQKQTGGMLPEHIGIIMDGNGRWATETGPAPFRRTQAPVPSVDRAVLPEHRNPVSDSLCLFQPRTGSVPRVRSTRS